MSTKASYQKSLSVGARVLGIFFLFIPLFRLCQVGYDFLTQGRLAALGQMSRESGVFRDLSLNPPREILFEFGSASLLLAGVGLAFLWIAKRLDSRKSP
jgi:hypothetical protein